MILNCDNSDQGAGSSGSEVVVIIDKDNPESKTPEVPRSSFYPFNI